jgi:tRNA pseudouridine38-40 synthase
MGGLDEGRCGVLLEVAYDGTAFHGWASQEKGRTVQDSLKGAILAIDAKASDPRGASRTDAGVHARGQLAAFDASLEIPPRGWVLALNQHLPDDVCVRRARAIGSGYEPRFFAKSKLYVYRVLLDRVRDPLLSNRAWRVGWAVDIERLTREAHTIVGTHDFAAFRAAADTRKSAVRTINHVGVKLEKDDPRILAIAIEGNAFLYNMVRILVGTLMDVARGRLEEGTIASALAGKQRKLAGATAPAHGLTLERIDAELPSGAGEPWPR